MSEGTAVGAPAAQAPSEASATPETANQAEATTAEEFEEIALGSVKGKLPKHLAKAVKDLERGFHSKAQESAQMRRQFQAQLEQFKGNPAAFFEAMGIDADGFSETHLASKLQKMAMSPEQRELAELKAYREQQEAAKKEAEKKDSETKAQVEQRKVNEAMDKEISEAFTGSGLPKDIYFVKQIAALQRESLILTQRGDREAPLTAKEAAAIVKQRYFQDQSSLVRNLEPKALLEFLGEDAFKKLREWDVARVTEKAAKTSPTNKSPGQKPASANHANVDSKRPMNEREYREYMKSLA